MPRKLYCARNILFIAMLSMPLAACDTIGASYEGLKSTVAKIDMPDLFEIARRDKKEERDEKVAQKIREQRALQSGKVNSDLPPVVASSAVVENPEEAYRADLAALGLDDDTNATLERTDDNTYVFKEKTRNTQMETLNAEPTMSAGMNCPDVSLVRELKSLHQFADPADPTIETKISGIEFTDVKSTCQVRDGTLVVDIDLSVKGGLGPKGRFTRNERPSFSYPYFLAITSMSGNIIAKDIYAFTASYGTEKNSYYGQDTIRQIMPLPDSGRPEDVSLLIGFQLTPEELAYNRTLSDLGQNGYQFTTPAPASARMQNIQPAAGYPDEQRAPVNRQPLDITSD